MNRHHLGGIRRAGGGLGMALLALMAAATAMAQSVAIDFVTVGLIGNASDSTGLGSVGYQYHMGKFEVTNSQYAAFLNATAKSDPFGLYNGRGITRTGTSGSFTYGVSSGFENKPAAGIDFWDAARFANWLGTGFTEGRAALGGPILTGAAYDLNFVTAPVASVSRLPGARVAVPSISEWYKAAYYQPLGSGGPSDNYWRFPTKSDAEPSASGPTTALNRANFSSGGVTNVGTYTGSAGFFGTYDMAGNLYEWTDTAFGSMRQIRGGGFASSPYEAAADFTYPLQSASAGWDTVGFRVVSLAPIPEPSTYAALAGLASLGVALWRRRAGRGTASA